MAKPRVHLRRLVMALALIGVVLLPANAVHAQPSLSQIEADIEAAWRELEPLIEEYNRVRSELRANQRTSDELAEQIAPLAADSEEAEAELAGIAAVQYKAGRMPGVGALLASGSPTRFVDRLAALERIARDQQQRIEAASETRMEFELQKAEIDALIEEQQEQEAELAERAEEIEENLADLEQMRDDAEQRLAQQQPEQAPSAPATTPQPSGSCPAVGSSGPGAVAAEFACSQRGKPYQWGATGPGSYDCSGLTQAAWAAAGVSLTHYTGAQWNEGYAVNRSEAVPGDLVFFYSDLSHVGVYVGNGMMVDAPTSGSTVQMRSIDTMPVAGFRRPG